MDRPISSNMPPFEDLTRGRLTPDQAREVDALKASSLHSDWPMLVRPVSHSMSLGLANLEHAAAGGLVDVALGHGLGTCFIGGSVTEYGCAFVGTGDSHSCDGTVFR